MPSFTVDTHLFRELGELLVGRDSTALIELIKNSYDADATEVVVLGEKLNDPSEGRIIISDNGTGMTPEEFENGFLRVASRLKMSGDRRSALFNRRFTGAKGIGRLAAHKLARLVEIESIPWSRGPNAGRKQIRAKIDWDEIESVQTLNEIEETEAIAIRTPPVPDSAKGGTVLRLSRLRRRWTPVERSRFFAEVQSFAPQPFLTKTIKRSVLREPLLFDAPLVRLAGTDPQEFDVRLEGEFASGHDYWRLMESHAAWVIEIHSRPGEDLVHYAISPTRKTLADMPSADSFSTVIPHPDAIEGPFFDARIFLRVGRVVGKRDERTWASLSSGVRVFMEGFRVLPYGEPGNDWLRLDADYTRRSRSLETLKRWGLEDIGGDEDKDAALTIFPNNNYFGAVFLVHEHAQGMRALVNREGFVPEGGYDHLVLLVRTGIDLCTRVHAAASYHLREKRRTERKSPRAGALLSAKELEETLTDAADALAKARAHIVSVATGPESQEITVRLGRTLEGISERTKGIRELILEQSLLRVLASVGTQMAEFVHELNALLGASQAVEQALSVILLDGKLDREQKRRLREVTDAVGELRRGIERDASYLTDIVTPDARRRRSRQRLAERFSTATRLVALHAERREIQIDNNIPAELKSPPMFPAELVAIFTNLLTNAVKASARSGGRICATAEQDDEGGIRAVVQNTGEAVDVSASERWFRPFVTTTSDLDPVLGQGMGLGLPITRRILEDYGARIRFIEPEDDFSAAVEIVFPK